MDGAILDQLLSDLGDLLGARGQFFHVAIVGGSALLLRRIVDRTTRDVDIVGVFLDEAWVAVDDLPPELERAVHDVAQLHGEPLDWFNAKPSDLLKVGLPAGWTTRRWEVSYGTGLCVSVVGREELIATKLYALVDQAPTSKHADDLIALGPEPDELERAATWCRHHDPSTAFADQLDQALSWLRFRLS